ncbi:hypothetical protein [Akkermansia sp.]
MQWELEFSPSISGARGRYAKASTTETVLSVADLSRDREKKVLELVENHCRFMNIGNVEGQMACFGDRIFKYFDKGQVGKSFIMKDIKNHTRPYEIFATDLLDVKANKAEGNNLFDYEAVAKIRLSLKKRAGQVRTQIITNFYGLKFQGDKPEIVYIDRIKE